MRRVNIPRILVIPRGPKGFGFILRGAKTIQAGVPFVPTAEIPALQFFEGVDMNGMAMKAGLKPGDFLLEVRALAAKRRKSRQTRTQIDSIDVRTANHDEVVQLTAVGPGARSVAGVADGAAGGERQAQRDEDGTGHVVSPSRNGTRRIVALSRTPPMRPARAQRG